MNKKIAILLVTLCAIFWGVNFNVGKILVGFFSPLYLASIRFLFASLLIIPAVLLTENRIHIMQSIKQNFWVYIVLSIIGIVGYNALFFEGLKYTTPINAALIMATNPPLTMFLAAYFLKETMSFSQKLGVLISLMSVGVVITHGSLTELLHLQISIGDMIIMLSNICWALYGVFGRRYLKNSNPLITTITTMFIGAIILTAMAPPHAGALQSLFHQSFNVYASLIYMVVFGTVLSYLFWNYGINQLGAGKTAIFFNLIPVVTTIMAIFLGQIVTPIQIIGGIAVIFGVLLSTSTFRLPIRFLRLNRSAA